MLRYRTMASPATLQFVLLPCRTLGVFHLFVHVLTLHEMYVWIVSRQHCSLVPILESVEFSSCCFWWILLLFAWKYADIITLAGNTSQSFFLCVKIDLIKYYHNNV